MMRSNDSGILFRIYIHIHTKIQKILQKPQNEFLFKHHQHQFGDFITAKSEEVNEIIQPID